MTAMRVAIDARTLQEKHRGGVGRGLANLLPLLGNEVEVHLLLDAHRQPMTTPFTQTSLPTPLPVVSASWLQWSAARWLRSFHGIFHCPYYGLPQVLDVPGVASLHDISFEHFPEWFSKRQGLSFRLQARRAARTAAALITGTEFIKRDIVATYDVDPDLVLVAPQGLDPIFHPDAEPTAALASFGLDRPYVLAIGGAPRRNLPLAVGAWQVVKDDIDLVVVGNEAVAEQPGLHPVGFVDDATLAALMAGAQAFLYPTAYEGFGMPALEAIGAGTPVVTAPAGSVPEVLGDAAAWADSLEVTDLGAALQKILGDTARHAGLRAAGIERARQLPGWDQAARIHLEAYRRAHALRDQRG